MTPDELAEAVGVRLVGKLAGGEGTGGYDVRTPDGTRAVLKVVADETFHRPMLDVLRARGYPVPHLLDAGWVDGTSYELTQYIPGAPRPEPLPAHVPQLIGLNDLQRDVGAPGRRPWVDDMVTSITEGREGYCELHALRAQDPALLDRLQRIADASQDVDVPTTDVVHCDFTTYNILFDGDTVTGVIDWSGATSGDATFDLVSLAFYTYDPTLHDQILDAARARTDPRALQLYAAHMTLRQVDWSLRNHDGDLVRWHTDAGLALLAAVGAG
jgi:hypothetical protein